MLAYGKLCIPLFMLEPQGFLPLLPISFKIDADPFLSAVEGLTQLSALYFILSYKANNMS